MDAKHPNPAFLSRQQLAERWSVSDRTIVRWAGRLPQEYSIGGRPRRKLDEIERYERACVANKQTSAA
jgi:hypothetical protein